ncbi:MAG: hypothetical protein BWK78_02460 [Thiotrichaceae bacterium IS1]|nr:MAG: hypothetical protein BWK78_02460 [Thiotrichaceae bacterium IS1]
MLNVNSFDTNFGCKRSAQKFGMFFMSTFFLVVMMPVWAVEVTNYSVSVIDYSSEFVLQSLSYVLSNGKEKPVVLNQALEAGEKVCVHMLVDLKSGDQDIYKTYFEKEENGKNLFLEVKQDDETIKVFPGNCSNEVEPSKLASVTKTDVEKMVENFITSTKESFTSLAKASYDGIITRFKSLATNEPTIIPLLGSESKPAKLEVGKQMLYLAWEGSQPSSYWVHIYLDGKSFRKDGFKVAKPEIVFPDQAKLFPSFPLLKDQKYKVEVKGEDNEKVLAEGVFKVEADVLPDEIAKMRDALLSEKDKDILIATLLIRNGLWLEAYQKVANQQRGIASSLRSFLTLKAVREECEKAKKPCFPLSPN